MSSHSHGDESQPPSAGTTLLDPTWIRWLSPNLAWTDFQQNLIDWFVKSAKVDLGFLWIAEADNRLRCVTCSSQVAEGAPLSTESLATILGAEVGYFAGEDAKNVVSVTKITECPGYPRAARLRTEGLVSAALVRLRVRGTQLGCVELLSRQPLGEVTPWKESVEAILPAVVNCVEERRRFEEHQFRMSQLVQAVSASRGGTWSLDVATRRMDLSPEWCALVGANSASLSGQMPDWETRVHPSDRPIFQERVARSLASNAIRCDFVFRLATAPNRYERALHQSTIERDASGRAVRMRGIHLVISESVENDLSQPISGQFEYASLVTPAGMFHTDPNGRCVYVNDRWCEISGLTREEALGDGWATALHPADRERVVASWNAATASKQVFRCEYRFVDRSGNVHWVFGQAIAMRSVDGEVMGFVGTITDLSERRSIESQAEIRNQFYQSLVETTDTGFCVIDSEGCVLEANGNYVRLIGRSSVDEVIGRNVLEWTWPAEMERNRREVMGAFERGYVRNLRMTYVNRMGERVPIEINATVVYHPSGPRAVALCRDIRDRIEIESRLEQTAAQLQFLSRRLLESHENERRHLARELHDEIGQVLTAVSVSLKSLQHEAPGAVASQLDDSVSLVDASIRQIRNMSLDLRPSMLDDLGLLPTVQWFVTRFGQRTGLQVELSVPPQLPRYPSTIETTCFRVVQESLTNVARHAQATHVVIQLESSLSGVRLRIVDNGLGFNPVDLLDRRQSLPTAGLLGMRERVQLLGGQLTVDSAVGSGTTISARFPVSEPKTLVFKMREGDS